MSCVIYFDNSNNRYSAGNVVRGRIVCHFSSSEEIRGIRVKLRGKEHTSWWGSESYYDSKDKRTKTRRVRFHGDNSFLQQEFTVGGAGTVGPGRLEYQFSFTLPTALPDTYTNAHGNIEYYVKANVDIPWAPDYEDKKNITVQTPIDFNRIPDLSMDQVCYEDMKNICCCCCSSGPITMKVYLYKEAFVITEMPKIRVHIVNMSNESIESLAVKIVMVIVSRATNPHSDKKTDKELIASVYDSGVGAHSDRTYNLYLDIPSTTFVPNFLMCSLFEMYTKLSIEARLPGCHTDMEIETPITLGHIPISGSVLVDGSYDRVVPVPLPLDSNPPPYIPPYPTEPPAFPTSLGFNQPDMSGPSAPPIEDVPSAPSKIEISNQDFEVINNDGGGCSVPPPSYNDAMKMNK